MKSEKRVLSLAMVITALVATLIFSLISCAKRKYPFISGTSQLMGTEVNITIYPQNVEEDYDHYYQTALGAIEEVSTVASAYNEESELYQLNLSAGNESGYTVSYLLSDLLIKAREVYLLTDGAFDPSVAPLVSAYGFDYHPKTGEASQPYMPTQNEIDALLPLVDFGRVLLDEESGVVFLPKDMRLDLGAIAKGYAADLACSRVSYSVKGMMVDIGGDIAIYGERPDGEPWVVAIADPREPEKTFVELAITKNCGIATSGDYERYFEMDGVRYGHIIDPDTGFPAQWMVSVTVIAPNATMADGLATAIFVLGVEKGLFLINGLPDVSAIIYTEEDGRLIAHYSQNAKDFISKEK